MALNYSALWRPGTGSQHWVTGIDLDAFRAEDKAMFDKGRRLKVLRINESGDNCTAVWGPGTDAQHWWTGDDFDQFKQTAQTFFQQGMRMQWIDGAHDRYTAVWRPGAGAEHWETGLTLDQFKQVDADQFAKGRRLVTMMTRFAGGYTYLGLWRTGAGGQHWWSGAGSDLSTFKQIDAQQQALGRRLTAFPPYGLNAIWRDGTGEQRVVASADSDTFKKTDADFFAKGLRLVDLSVGESY